MHVANLMEAGSLIHKQKNNEVTCNRVTREEVTQRVLFKRVCYAPSELTPPLGSFVVA